MLDNVSISRSVVDNFSLLEEGGGGRSYNIILDTNPRGTVLSGLLYRKETSNKNKKKLVRTPPLSLYTTRRKKINLIFHRLIYQGS